MIPERLSSFGGGVRQPPPLASAEEAGPRAVVVRVWAICPVRGLALAASSTNGSTLRNISRDKQCVNDSRTKARLLVGMASRGGAPNLTRTAERLGSSPQRPSFVCNPPPPCPGVSPNTHVVSEKEYIVGPIQPPPTTTATGTRL